MQRTWAFALGFILLFSSQALGQSASSDSRTLQSLLQEVHELRLEVENIAQATATAQQAQILIYRAQAEGEVVARASSRLDAAKQQLENSQSRQTRLADAVKHWEDAEASESDPNKLKQDESVLRSLKPRLDAVGNEAQQDQAAEVDAEQQLQFEQAKLSELQSRLDRLETTLGDSSGGSKGNPQ